MKALGEIFAGTLISDFFGAYNIIKAVAKQKCLVHLFRELEKFKIGICKEWDKFCEKLKTLLKDAIQLKKQWDDLDEQEYARQKTKLYERLEKLYDKEKYNNKECRRIAKRLFKYRDEIFTFLEQKEVPYENNYAERQIRPAVIMRKNSYCNRSENGAKTQSILMSIFQTSHLKGENSVEAVLETVKTSLSGQMAE